MLANTSKLTNYLFSSDLLFFTLLYYSHGKARTSSGSLIVIQQTGRCVKPHMVRPPAPEAMSHYDGILLISACRPSSTTQENTFKVAA